MSKHYLNQYEKMQAKKKANKIAWGDRVTDFSNYEILYLIAVSGVVWMLIITAMWTIPF